MVPKVACHTIFFVLKLTKQCFYCPITYEPPCKWPEFVGQLYRRFLQPLRYAPDPLTIPKSYRVMLLTDLVF